MKPIQRSVHDIVDFVLRTGDLDNRIFNRATMQTGTDMHRRYQQQITIPGYHRELLVEGDFTYLNLHFHIIGKADGLYEKGEMVIVEELKTAIADLPSFHKQHETWHLIQGLFYGYMYAIAQGKTQIKVKLIYMHQTDNERLEKEYDFSIDEAKKDLDAVIKEYGEFYTLILNQQQTLANKLPNLQFPFKSFREGQRTLAKYVYGISQKGGRLFVEAPTGIGKTMSTLFPMIKGLYHHHQKVFYFTAKNSGKLAAIEALDTLRKQGIPIRYVVISAKDKISFCPRGKINPDDCLYARGYYNKIKDVLLDALQHEEAFTPQKIEQIAEHHQVEPFELSLDLSLYVDVIIADYNYMFDPNAYLRRFFESVDEPYAVLIDEAHNLVDRSRDMYSASITQVDINELENASKKSISKPFKNRIKRLTKAWRSLVADLEVSQTITIEPSFTNQLEAFIHEAQLEMKEKRKSLPDKMMDVYFKILRYFRLKDYQGEQFRDWLEVSDEGKILHYDCLDASRFLHSLTQKLHSVVFFSATLAPVNFYLPMLGGQPTDAQLWLPSPFPRKNFKVMLASKVSTTLKNRGKTFLEVALYLEKLVENHLGNYLIFFPSYQYLESVKAHLNFPVDTLTLTQKKEMTTEEREAFLSQFTAIPTQTTVGLAVLGGTFSEGIDLIGNRLIGVGIVSVGLPQLSFSRDMMANHYEQKGQDGFAFAYVYPAINKVLQAMGRVIRSEKDRGVALLIDERYLQEDYGTIQERYPQYEVVHSPDDVETSLIRFFDKD